MSLTRLCSLRFKRTRIIQIARIALWAWLLENKNINRKNTLWANSHASSFDVKIWLYDYVSKLYDSHSHIFPSEQFLLFALWAINSDKPLLEV